MKINQTLLAVILAASAVPALADDTVTVPGAAPLQVQARPEGGFTVQFDSPSVTQSLGGRPAFGFKLVKNAPYSALVVNERQQNLGDGNQITQRHDSATWYRDSAGRTRFEARDGKGELRLVTINDPVVGATWALDPVKRSARKLPVRADGAAARRDPADTAKAVAAARARIEQMRKDGTLPTVERLVDADGNQEIIVKRVERGAGGSGTTLPTEIHIKRPQASGATAATGIAGVAAGLHDTAPLGIALASAMNDREWKAKTVTKDLGTREFGGVKAEGKLSSYEIPAGAIGNRNAIVVSDETWYAPALQITVYTKHSDPRSGDSEFRLENLKREEPAAALFTVPTDYTIKEPLARVSTK